MNQEQQNTSDLDEFREPDTVPSNRIDAVISLVIILGAGFFLLRSQQLTGSTLGTSEYDPGPALWPRAVLIVILAAGLLNLWLIYVRMRANKQSNTDETDWSVLEFGLTTFQNPSKERMQYIVAIVALMAYIVLLDSIGFIAVTPVFLFIFAWVNEYRAPGKLAIFSIGMTILLFLAFNNLMNLAIPYGTGPIRDISILLEGLI